VTKQKRTAIARFGGGLSIRRTWPWAALGALVVVALVVVLLPGWGGGEEPMDLMIDFQQYRYGIPPEEFDYDATGPYGPVLIAGRPFWRTYVDLFAPSPQFVIIQASTLAEPDHYPIALLKDVWVKDVTLTVWVKPMGGEVGKSAGILWRAQDEDDYYAVLIDPLDDQLHLLEMVGGQPYELAAVPIEVDVEFERQEPSATWGWYALRAESEGDQISVGFQGEKVLEVTDTTFRRAGRVGFITHADSVALFDDFRVQVGEMAHTATPRPTVTPALPPVMHVAAITTTDVLYDEPVSVFDRGGYVYWMAQVVDESGVPVAGATVYVDILYPDGSLLETQPMRAGSTGIALFQRQFDASEPTGTYTLRVSDITYHDVPGAVYDAAASTTPSVTFTLR
jgi:hypothetical protein